MEGEGSIYRAQKPSRKPTWAFSFSNAQQVFSLLMARKSFFAQTLATFFVILATYALFNTFFNPTVTDSSTVVTTYPFNSDTTSITSDTIISAAVTPSVKVFLYDIPWRFTYGVINGHSTARGGRHLTAGEVDDASYFKYPGHQHMGEWYLFKDLTRPESDRVGSPVTRVIDPEEAELFYVPFFSSLSLIVNTGRARESLYSDEETQEALLEWLEGQEYWKRNNGRDHVFMASDPNALFRIVDRVRNSVLLVVDFGRLKREEGSLVKDVVVPYSHRLRTYEGEVGIENRRTLLFFMGNRYRKEV